MILGEIEGRGRRGRQRMSWLDSISDSTDMNLSTLQEIVKVRGTWRAAAQSHRGRHDSATEQHRGVKTPSRGDLAQPLPSLYYLWLSASLAGGPAAPPPPQAEVLSSCGPHTLLHPEHGTSFTQLIPTRLMTKSFPVSFLLRTTSFSLTEGQNFQLRHFEVQCKMKMWQLLFKNY